MGADFFGFVVWRKTLAFLVAVTIVIEGEIISIVATTSGCRGRRVTTGAVSSMNERRHLCAMRATMRGMATIATMTVRA